MPPPSDDDVDYYEVLGVSATSSLDEIRKAYKKKSLALHPDKILQRGGNPDDYRKEYQDIQEAHTVLTDDKKRQTYNLVNRSSTRYKFLSEEGAFASAYENLVKSSRGHKARLVVLMAILICFMLLQPILVCVKVNQELANSGALASTSWVVILIPWWLLNILFTVIMLVIALLSGCNLVVLFKFAETLSFFVGQVVLALRWDHVFTEKYAIVFIPIYFGLVLRWIGRGLTMRQMSRDVVRMITIEKLEEELGKPYQDCSEEEQEELAQLYIIVHVPPDVMVEEAGEEQDFVQFTPEYHSAMEVYYQSFSDLVIGLLFGIPLMVMITLKVDGHYTGSWWIVFVPAWVYLGTQIFWNCYSCCCGSVSGEEVVMAMDASENEGESSDENKEEEEDTERGGFVDPSSSVTQFNRDPQSQTIPQGGAFDSQAGGEQVTPENQNAGASSGPTSTGPANILEETKVEESEPPELDEEAFNNFQQAYEAAEASAMEAQAKAVSSLCSVIFQLTIVCLIVGKLEQDVPPGNETGYNAIWILFPFLIIAGCILCCWTCLICGAGQDGLDNLVERVSKNDGEEVKEQDEEISAPAQPLHDSAVHASNNEHKSASNTQDKQTDVEATFYDDGLD